MAKAVKLLNDAIRKDDEHYYKESIDLYEEGIEIIIRIMKCEQNAGKRFALAKRLDCYIQRVNYLKI